MTSQIVKTTDEIVGSLTRRTIFGLNIFPDDHPKSGLADPRFDFLRGVCSNNQASAITGSLYDFANVPKELFGDSNYRNSYETVRIGCYGGDFYDSKDWSLFPPLFFPLIAPDFFDIEHDPNRSYDNSLIFSIVYADALALFISPKSDDSESELRNLLNQPLTPKISDPEMDKLNFLNQPIEYFLERTAGLYEIVLTTQADGDYFEGYSQKVESFGLMDQSLKSVIADIEDSNWYRENKANLIWDDEDSGCLVLK